MPFDVRQVWKVLGLVAQAQRQVHLMRAGCGVGHEGDVVLIERVISVIAQALHYQVALAVELLVVKWRRALYREIGSVGKYQVAQTIVGDVVGYRPDAVRLVEGYKIVDLGLFLLGVKLHLAAHLVLKVALVGERSLQLVLARRREGGVINHWWSAHAPDPFVEPVARVLAAYVVNRQLQLQSSQHLMVLGLAQVIGQFLLVQVFGVLLVEDVDFHLVKQQLPVGHMLGRRTRKQHWHKCQEQQSCQYVSSLNRHLQSRQHRLTRLLCQINAQS